MCRGLNAICFQFDLKKKGTRAGIVLIVQRPDADYVQPNELADPIFGQVLKEAVTQGVDVYAYK